MINKPSEINTNAIENTETFWYCCQSTMIKYHEPLFKQEQVEVVKEVVLPEVSKLSDTVINKSHRDQKQFSPGKRDTKKREMGLVLSAYSLSAITKTNKQTSNIFFYRYTSSRSTYHTIL